MSDYVKNKRFLPLLLMRSVILVLGFSTALMAATAGRPSGPGPLHAEKGGSIAVGAAKMVNMEELPMATAAQLAAKPRYEPDRRPLDNLTEKQYEALKLEVAHRWAGAPSGTAAIAHEDDSHKPVVGAFANFAAQQENCCTPPDMALAVSENFVVQM